MTRNELLFQRQVSRDAGDTLIAGLTEGEALIDRFLPNLREEGAEVSSGLQ